MRTVEEKLKRKTMYRILSVVFLLIGATKFALAIIDHGKIASSEYLARTEGALVWFVLAATWVALSRIWGELANESSPEPKP